MNVKFIISVVVLFVLSMGFGFLIHGTLLSDQYAQLPNLYRSMEDGQNYFGFMIAAHVLIAIGRGVAVRVVRREDRVSKVGALPLIR